MGMQYADPIEPATDVNDFIRSQTVRVGTDTVTHAAGTASSPSKPRSSFTLPKTGIASRLYLDFVCAYDFTAGGGTGAVAADGRGPFQIVDRIEVAVNGGAFWFNVSGFGTYLLNAAEEAHSFPQDAPGTVYTTAPTDVASTIYNYAAAADGTTRFGLEVPFTLRPDNPIGMLLLHNDQTTVQLNIVWGNLDAYAALAGGASATLSTTVTVTMEYFDVPDRGVFAQWFLPYLQWAHVHNEEQQVISAQGRAANAVVLDNHDTYLKIIHAILTGTTPALDTDHVTDIRLMLNRNTTLRDDQAATHLRTQRRKIGKDLPVFMWNLFDRNRLRDALRADLYTDVRSEIDITGATLAATSKIVTVTEKLVWLGPIGAGV